MIVKELVARLGLDVDAGAFEAADALIGVLRGGLVAVGAAAGAVVLGLAGAAAATASYGGEIDDMAQRTGLATDTLQELRYAAGLTGTNLDAVAGSLTKLTMNMASARDGNKEAAAGFARLGISVLDAHGKLRLTDDVLTEAATKIAAISNPTERTAAAIGVFGKSAGEIMPLLRQGGAGLAALRQEARDLGLVLDQETIAKADELGDSMDSLQFWLGAVVRMAGAELLDPLIAAAKATLEWAKANRELIKTRLVQTITVLGVVLKPVVWALGVLVKTLELLVRHADLAAYTLGSVLLAALIANGAAIAGNVLGFLALSAGAVMAAASAAAAWIAAAAPFVALAALILFLVLLVEDFYYALTGGESALADWGKSLEEWAKSPIDGDWWPVIALKALIYMLTDVATRLPEALGEWGKIFADYFTTLGKNIAKLFFAALRGDLKGQASALLDIIPGGDDFGKSSFDEYDRAGHKISSVSLNDYLGRGASSPSASVAQSVNTGGGTTTVVRPQEFKADFSVVAAPGQDPQQVGMAVRQEMDSWYDGKMRESLVAVEN